MFLPNFTMRIGDVRGAGLYLGVEMVKDRASREPDSARALALVNEMRNRRVLNSREDSRPESRA